MPKKLRHIVTAYSLSSQEFREIEKENNTLKKLLGEKDLEIAILRSGKKDSPGLSDRIEIANNWIARGYACSLVLRIVGVHEATYYHRKKRKDRDPINHKPRNGRPNTAYSWTKDR